MRSGRKFANSCIVLLAVLSATALFLTASSLSAQTPTTTNNGLPFLTGAQHPISQLEIDHGSLTLVSGGCVRTDSLLRFTVVGSSQQGDSLTALQLLGSANFQLLSAPSIPSPVGLLDSISVGYTSQGSGIDTGWLKLEFVLNGVLYDTSIVLIGQNPGPAVNARPQLEVHAVGIAAPSIGQHLTVNAGDLVTVGVHLDHDLPLSGRVDSLELNYLYDDDALTVQDITPTAGWNVAVEQSFGGVARFRLVPDSSVITRPGAMLNASDVLAQITFKTTLSRSPVTSVVLDQFSYYLDSVSSHGCATQEVESADSVSIAMTQQCGNGELSDLMNTFNVLNILSLYPNPVGTPDQVIQVTFDLNTDTHVTVSVTDAMGKEVSKVFDNDLTVGEHSVGLNSTTIPDGVYFVVVVVNGQRVIRKIVVSK